MSDMNPTIIFELEQAAGNVLALGVLINSHLNYCAEIGTPTDEIQAAVSDYFMKSAENIYHRLYELIEALKNEKS